MMRTCPLCNTRTARIECCGILLAQRVPFRMTKLLIRRVHAAVAKKGLGEEIYRLRLGAVGVATCKDFSRDQYHAFMRALATLPDAPARLPVAAKAAA